MSKNLGGYQASKLVRISERRKKLFELKTHIFQLLIKVRT
jgi:hypothetical protein